MIRTPTLAEIYARQGHLEQAIEMYEALCADKPDEASWQQRLESLRHQLAELDDPGAAERGRKIAALKRLSSRVQSRRRDG